jgi:glycosyltransferase involved in cell wall biosynthesis
MLEGWSLGLGIVAAAIGPMPSLIEDGQTGRLVSPRDPAALAAILQELSRHPKQLAHMGEQGRQLVAQSFTWPHQIERTVAVLEEVV